MPLLLISSLVALIVGERILAWMMPSLGVGERVRRALGMAVLAGVAAIAFGLFYSGTATLEQGMPDNFGQQAAAEPGRPFHSNLPVKGRLPSLDGAVEWLNSPPLSSEQLRGKVVLVDFWTYSCINCIRTLPYVQAWAAKYKDQGLVVIGVHTPEFAFEKKIGNVKKAVGDFKIAYPVAIDNNFKVWRAFDNSYWPALYFVDAKGQIRHQQFGEGNYEKSEKVIQELLRELSAETAATVTTDPVAPDAKGAEAAPDLRNLRSGETYLGSRQASNFVSPQGLKAGARDYSVASPKLNEWGLIGNWT
ncbi:MAG: dipZ, partial [Hyphomicrobiales bacterium]|nr:dipZ [Hyphomicrobiales bacterium]